MSLRVPLATLRESLDTEHERAQWALDRGERTLTIATDQEVIFPLTLDGELRVQGRARLPIREWLDGAGELFAWAAVTSSAGRREIGRLRLRAADAFGRPEGVPFAFTLPADATGLVLGTVREVTLGGRAVLHAEWVEPELVDEHTSSPPVGATPRASGPAGEAPPPRFSILTPVHDPPVAMLEAAIASVLAQTYENWQLCLADDGCTDRAVIELLARHAAADARIQLTRSDTAAGISAATNHALALADGDFVIALDHDDTLAAEALATVAARLREDPGLDMIYSDEAIVAGDRVLGINRKPGWGLAGLQCLPYANHLGVYRRTLVQALGGLQSRFDGCQDYDLALRIAERSDRVAHIPEVLYHWHAHDASTAGGEMAKPWAYLRQREALIEHLQRIGVDADVQFGGQTGTHRIVHRVAPTVAVTIVAELWATDDAEARAQAAELRPWAHSAHRAWDLVLVAPRVVHPAIALALEAGGIEARRVTLIDASAGTGLAAGVAAARGDVLLLMSAPCAALDRDCLTRLAGYALAPETSAAGPVLHARDGRVVQAGVALPRGVPLVRLYGAPSRQPGQIATNVSALDTILATARATYEQTGGLDTGAGPLSLIDYCLRAGTAGRRAVVMGDCRVREPLRVPAADLAAIRRLHARWRATGQRDPYYHPSFRPDRDDLAVSPV